MTPVIALDAMGGDRAPAEIVAGALRAAAECDVDVLLVGRPDAIAAHLPGGTPPTGVAVLGVRGDRDGRGTGLGGAHQEGLVARGRRPRRQGRPGPGAGPRNTGATMAAALLGYGRIRGVHRPAIAVPLPAFGTGRPQLLIDGGATVDPQPEWLVEWAHLGPASRVRLGVEEPTVALLSNGEEPGKGDALRKAASAAARRGEGLDRQRQGPRSAARRPT